MNAERLLKLANHLMNGKLGHEVFDFGMYNDSVAVQSCSASCHY